MNIQNPKKKSKNLISKKNIKMIKNKANLKKILKYLNILNNFCDSNIK